ncbi:MAG: PadR family transcriptional regulator [Eubacterium sp.]|nr:PadR family transcriptional regulator [Eubacterium sp.]
MQFQLGSGFLDACVLAVVAQEDTYGYSLTQRIKGVFDISESTLYPVLRRLQKEACLSTYDKPFQGRNRRYYRVTDTGIGRLEDYRRDWQIYKNQIDLFLDGGESHE